MMMILRGSIFTHTFYLHSSAQIMCQLKTHQYSRVGDCASGRDCGSGYEKYRVCTCRYSSANTLGESAKVVCQACLLDVPVGATHRVGIFQRLTSVRVNHDVGVVCAAVLSSDEMPSGSRITGAGARMFRV